MDRQTREPDKWDIKAERVHGSASPEGDAVRIVAIDIGLGTVLRLAVLVGITWAIIGGVMVIALIALGVI